MLFGKLKACMPIAESVYGSEERLPHLTALLSYSLGQLAVMIRFLEESAIFATKKRSRTVHFPEGREMIIRMDTILTFIKTEMTEYRAFYQEGPNFNAVHNQWQALVARYVELRQQVEFVD
jgi:hypothetical protein